MIGRFGAKSGVPPITPGTSVQGPPHGIAPEQQFSQGHSVAFCFRVPHWIFLGDRSLVESPWPALPGILEVIAISSVMTGSSQASWVLSRSLQKRMLLRTMETFEGGAPG